MAVEANPRFAVSAAALTYEKRCRLWILMVLLMTGFSSGPSFIVLSRIVAFPLFSPSDKFCFHRFLLSAGASHDLVSVSHAVKSRLHTSLKRSLGQSLRLAPVASLP